MANYLAMNREELAAEKAALEAEYKKFQAKGLKLNMARGSQNHSGCVKGMRFFHDFDRRLHRKPDPAGTAGTASVITV